MSSDKSPDLIGAVRKAVDCRDPLCPQGGNTKGFYGRKPRGEKLSVAEHTGIVTYEPTELIITVRSGTLLSEVESTLRENDQMLAFEPPGFGDGATMGGTVACGFSGPRRPYTGSARDFVLGLRIVNGKGEDLSFGGQVMKNVAGYDVSRLLTGSLGTLGLILEVSLKVLPAPKSERTVVFEADYAEAAALQMSWAKSPIPISATCHHEDRLYVRLSGSGKAVSGALRRLGGEELERADGFWWDLREHQLRFFNEPGTLWRISVPPATPDLRLDGDCLTEWGGALRWLRRDDDEEEVRDAATACGGHAISFRGDGHNVFHPLNPSLLALHKRIKHSFDPEGIFNPGRMYEEF